jgi:hypothetical protein
VWIPVFFQFVVCCSIRLLLQGRWEGAVQFCFLFFWGISYFLIWLFLLFVRKRGCVDINNLNLCSLIALQDWLWGQGKEDGRLLLCCCQGIKLTLLWKCFMMQRTCVRHMMQRMFLSSSNVQDSELIHLSFEGWKKHAFLVSLVPTALICSAITCNIIWNYSTI